jgi:Txe/YoeB family toxin of Txe-Axe toxin-antitoxin module
MYTVVWIKKFDTNDEWLKQIGAVHPEYAQRRLFGIKVASVVDSSAEGTNLHSDISNIYCFFTSLDELQGFVSSTFMKIGERADTDSDWQELGGEAGVEVKKRLAAYDIPKEGLQQAPNESINDSPDCMIHKNRHKYAVKFNCLLPEVAKNAEAAGTTGSMSYQNVGLSQFYKDQRTVTSQVTRTVRYWGNGIQERLNEIGKRSKIVLGDKVALDSNFYTGLTMNRHTILERIKSVANLGSFIGNWDQLKKNNKLVSGMKLTDGKIEFAYKKGKDTADFDFLSHKGSGILAIAEEVQEVFNPDDESFYVDSVNAQDYEKMTEYMGEKGIAQGISTGLNEYDGHVDKALSYKHSKQLADEDTIHNTIFTDIGSLNKTKYEEIIIKTGFGSNDASADEIWRKRYKASRILMGKALEDKVSYSANHSLKSNNRAFPVGDIIYSVAEKHKGSVLSEEERLTRANDEIDSVFESEDGLRDENYKFIVEHIDRNVLTNSVRDHKLVYEPIDLGGKKHRIVGQIFRSGNSDGHTSTAVLSEVAIYGGITSSGEALTEDEVRSGERAAQLQISLDKGMKVITREPYLLDLKKYDSDFIELFAKNSSKSKFDESFGHILERNKDDTYAKQNGSHVIKKKYRNRSILKIHSDSSSDNLPFKPDEFELTDDSITKSSKQLSPVLAEDFADYAFTVKEHTQAKGQKVSKESNAGLYRAQRWNTGNSSHDIKILSGGGLYQNSIDDAIRASDNDVDNLFKSRNCVLSGNTVLDLSPGVHGGEHLVNGSDRYLALTILPRITDGSEVIKWKSKEAVQGLISHQRLLNAYNNVPDLSKDLLDNSLDAYINSDFLSKAKTGSNSFLHHFQERRGYDIEGLTAEMFERLDYFKDEAISQYGIDAFADDAREQMMSLIKEKKTRMFSPHPGLAFLDRNVKHNSTFISAEGRLSAGGNFDGELAVNALAKYQYTDTNQKTQHINYVEYMTYKEKGQAVDPNIEEVFKDNKVFMAQHASVVNKYYINKVNADVLDDTDKAVTDYDAFTIPDSAFLENRIVGILGTLEKSSATADHLKMYSKLQTKMNEAYSKTNDSHIIVGDIDKYYKSAVLCEIFGKQEMSAIAKYSKLTIDGVNLPLFSIPRIADAGFEETTDTTKRQHVVHDFSDAMEQEVIFPKKEKDIRSIANNAERFKHVLDPALGRSGQESDSLGLRSWTDDYLGKIESIAHKKEKYGFEKQQRMAETFLESIGGLNRESLNNLQQFENLGQQRGDTSHRYLQDALVYAEHDDPSPSQVKVWKRLNQTSPEIGVDALRRDEAVSDTASTVRKAINGAIVNLKRTPKEPLNDSKQLLSKIRHQMGESGVTAKSLAFTAVGLAESVMAAGFVGGNPSKSAVTHAQDDSEDEYRIPPLTDSNLNNSRGGPKPGYVININAQTNQGQEHASSVIQQALSSGFNNTNINVAMNIHNPGQANAAQISRMLESAFQ